MYGNYRLRLNLDEAIGEISRILSAVSNCNMDYKTTSMACAHYKQLALVCACAFMMSPVARVLKDRTAHAKVRRVLFDEVDAVYAVFAQESGRWGKDATMAVVVELAYHILLEIIHSIPNLENTLGVPTLYNFTPTQVGNQAGEYQAQRIQPVNPILLDYVDDPTGPIPEEFRLGYDSKPPPEHNNILTFTLWVRTPPAVRRLN
jgi:hypothetical protein